MLFVQFTIDQPEESYIGGGNADKQRTRGWQRTKKFRRRCPKANFRFNQMLRRQIGKQNRTLQTDMDCFRHEMKENLKDLKATVNNIEKSLETAWVRRDSPDDHSQELKAQKDVNGSQQ